MAQGDPYTGKQFVHAEWLGDIVIGPKLERLDNTAFVGAAGEDDDWHKILLRTPAPQQFVTLNIRQSEIQDNQIRRAALHMLDRGPAVGRLDRRVALSGQSHAKQAADRR